MFFALIYWIGYVFDLRITVKMINLLAFIGDVYEVIDVPQNEAMGGGDIQIQLYSLEWK